MSQLSFDQIKGLHSQAQAKGLSIAGGDLKSFASVMQQNDRDNDWSQGTLPDNAITGISRAIDRGFEATGLPEVTGNVGGSFGSLIDSVRGNGNDRKYENLGQSVGKSIPRMATGAGLAIGGAALAPASGGSSLAAWAPAATLIGLGAGDAAAKAYSDTGSLGAAGVSAATVGLAPGISSVGSRLGVGALGRVAPSIAANPMAKFVASEIGQEAAFFGAGAIGSAAQGENPFTPENIFSQAVGTAAFAPLTIGRGISAARAPKAKPNLETGLIETGFQSRAAEESPVNDNARLFDFLAGKQDEGVAKAFSSGNFKQALELTGLLDPDINNVHESAARRYKGRQLVDKLAEQNDFSGDANARLMRKAAHLLQTPEIELTDFVKRVAAVNAFERKFRDQQRGTPLLGNRPGFEDVNAQQALHQRMATGAAEGAELNAIFQQADIALETKLAFNSLESRRAREIDPRFPTDTPKIHFGDGAPLILQPEQASPRVQREAGRFENKPKVRGRVNPDALRERLSRPEWSKVDSTLIDTDGQITAKSISATFDENLLRDLDPDTAMARTDAQIRGVLKNRIIESQPGFVQSGLSVASKAFDEMGLDSALKDTYLQATHGLLSNMSVLEGTTVRPLQDMLADGTISAKEAEFAAGVFVGDRKQVGVDGNLNLSTPELKAFHFVKNLAHESFHALTRKILSDDYFGIDSSRVKAWADAHEYARSVDESQRRYLLNHLYDTVAHYDREGKNYQDSVSRYAATTPEEFMTEYGGMLAMALNSSKADKIATHLRWAPQVIQDFARALFRTMDEIKTMTLRSAEALGFKKAQIQELSQFHENLKRMMEPDPVAVKAQADVQGAMQPFRVLNKEISPFDIQWSKVGSPAIDEATAKVRPANLFERRFGTLQQLTNSMRIKERVPEASDVVHYLTTLGANITKNLNVIRSGMMVTGEGGLLHELATTADKQLTPAQIKLKSNFARVEGSLVNRTKLSQVYTKMNELVMSSPDEVTFTHPDLQALLKDVSPEDVNAMQAVFDSQIEANRNAAAMIQNSMLERSTLDIARIYKSAGAKAADARQAAGVLMSFLVEGKIPPPDLMKIAGSENAVNFWTEIQPAYRELVGHLDRPHASELRTGRWQQKYLTPTGETGRVSANNKQELHAIKRQLTKDGNTLDGAEIDNQNREFNEFDAVPTAMAESLIRLENSRMEAAYKTIADDHPEAVAAMREAYSLGQGIASEVNKRKQFMAERKMSPGREYIDMYANQGAYAEVVAASAAKKTARQEIAWLLESENWAKEPKLQKELESFANDILATRNSSELTQNIKKTTMFVTMGANISGAIMDSSQSLMVGTFRIAESMGVPEAFKTISRGYLEVFNPKNTEFQGILTRATNDGLLQSGSQMNDIVTINDQAGYNVARAGDRRNLVPLSDHLTNHEFMAGKVMDMVKEYGGKLFNGVMIPTKASGQLNNKVMLYAGMVEGQKLGLKGEALYQHATRVSQVTNFQGGRGAQSSFKTKFGQANNWVEVATLLTNYPISVMSQMYGNYRSALKSSGLSPAQRRRAAEVFAGQLTLQFGMAGTMGLGLGVVSKLAEQVFGYSPEEEVRKGLAALDSSGTLSDILLNGVANKASGIDFASRFSLGGVAGLNDFTGFDAKGVFGPSTSVWSGLAALPSDIKSGNLSKSTLMPNGIRKMIEASTPGSFKDRSGQTIIDPTTTERITKFIGFNPDRMTKVYDQRSLYKFAEEQTTKERQEKTRERIDLLNKGDFTSVHQSLRDEVAEMELEWRAAGVPPLEIKAMRDKELRSNALQLVDQAVKKTFELDPLSGGNTASAGRRQAIAASFGNSQAARDTTPEQQALGARLLQGLGQAAVKRSPRSIRITQLTQQLIAEDPTMPEQTARVLATSLAQ